MLSRFMKPAARTVRKCMCILLILSFAVSIAAFAEDGDQEEQPWKVFYVAQNGSDSGDGSSARPFQTLKRAQEAVREINDEMQGNIEVIIGNGTYYLEDTLRFRMEDSGKNGHEVIYRAADGAEPVISGGRPITGFTEGENGIWQAQVTNEEISGIRELSVNGRAAELAISERSYEGITNYDDPNTLYTNDGLVVDSSLIQAWGNPKDIVFNWPLTWHYYKTKVEDIRIDPDNPEQTFVTFQQPWWNYMATYTTTDFAEGITMGHYTHLFTIENAFELLDTPGEFYFDKQTRTLYYMPREGEDMTTATAIAPVLETLVDIRGEHVGAHIENISFRGLTFSDATWYLMHNYSYLPEQNRVLANSESTDHPAGILIYHATNVNVTECVIKNMAYFGLKASDGVYDSSFIGNACFDMGGGAIAVGERWHAFPREVTDPNAPADVFGRKPYYVSSTATASMRASYMRDNLFEHQMYGDGAYWRSHEDDAHQGIYSWMKADLEKAYNIDYIELFFNEESLTDNAAQNFDVLVSNDFDFADYKVLHHQGGENPENNVLRIKGDGNKYRYVMVRKTELEPLTVAEMYVYSYDEKPVQTEDSCSNIQITDNYVERTGHIFGNCAAIDVMLGDHINIEHNEVRFSSYINIMCGWGWSLMHDSTTCHSNIVRGNICEMPLMRCVDGGSFYTNSQMPDSIIEENYFISQVFYTGPIYHDPGSRGIDVRRNVAEIVPAFPDLPNFDYWDIHYYDNYSAQPYQWLGVIDPSTILEPTTLYIPGREPAEAKEIIENAGVRPEYQHMKSKVLNNKLMMGEGRNLYDNMASAYGGARQLRNFHDQMGKHFLSSASFGNLPGQYDPYMELELQYLMNRYNYRLTTMERDESIEVPMRLQEAFEKFRESVNDLPFEEVIQYCEELADSAVIGDHPGQYQQTNLSSFVAAIEQAKNTEDDTYTAQIKLEQALREFYNSGNHMEILALTANQLKNTKIDAANKTVTVTLPKLTDLKKVTVAILTTPDAVVQTDFSEPVDLRWDKQIMLYNEELGESSVWTLRAELEDEQSSENVYAPAEKWYNADEYAAIDTDNGVNLPQSYVPYMLKGKVFEGVIRAKFTTDARSALAGIQLVFGTGKPDVLYNGTESENDHLRLEIKGDKSYLYAVRSGEKITLASGEGVSLNASEANELLVEYQGRNVKVTLNGTVIINALALDLEIPEQTYAGFYLPYSSITLME